MSKIKVHGGDYEGVDGTYTFGTLIFPNGELFSSDNYSCKEIEELEIANEENVKKTMGTIGWGAIGGIALGPVGLLAGLLLGGRGKEVTFVAKFKNGKKILASTDSKTYTKIQAKSGKF